MPLLDRAALGDSLVSMQDLRPAAREPAGGLSFRRLERQRKFQPHREISHVDPSAPVGSVRRPARPVASILIGRTGEMSLSLPPPSALPPIPPRGALRVLGKIPACTLRASARQAPSCLGWLPPLGGRMWLALNLRANRTPHTSFRLKPEATEESFFLARWLPTVTPTDRAANRHARRSHRPVRRAGREALVTMTTGEARHHDFTGRRVEYENQALRGVRRGSAVRHDVAGSNRAPAGDVARFTGAR